MSLAEYHTILIHHLMIPLFLIDEVCPVYLKTCQDTFGKHAIHCKELLSCKYIHDFVGDAFYDVFRQAGASMKNEGPVNFFSNLLDGRSTLRPTNVMVYEWVGGKHACVDLTGVLPLV